MSRVLQFRIPLITLTGLFLLSCAGAATFTNRPDDIAYLRSLINRQSNELTSYAALLRVKTSRNGKLDDFRTEIYSRKPDELSLYVRGFLGKSAFKAVSNGDSLLFYLTDSKEYFRGTYNDLMIGQLQQTSHILSAIRALFRGSVEIPSDSLWEFQLKRKGDHFTLRQTDLIHRFQSLLDFNTRPDQFPYIEPKRLEIKSHDERFRSVYEFKSYSFNKEIPDSKFEIEMSKNAVKLTAAELVDYLSNLD